MSCLKLFICPFLTLIFSPPVVGQGNVPGGSFTVEVKTRASFLVESEADCDKNVRCAGVTYREDDRITFRYKMDNYLKYMMSRNTCSEKADPAVFYHGFLPALNDENTSPWVTHRSTKEFVYHPGRILPGYDKIYETITWIGLEDAKARCSSDSACVGFTFPVGSTDLHAANNVTFVTEVSEVIYLEDDSWRTFISNDPSRASSVNHQNLKFDLKKKNHKSCCDRTGPLPSVDEIKAVDTLERIPCNISRPEFQFKYESRRQPVILVGCDEGWSAQERWEIDALIPRFDNESTWRAELNPNSGLGLSTWESIVDAMNYRQHFYVFEPLDGAKQKTIAEDYETPGPFRNVDLYENLDGFPPAHGVLRWISIGSKYSGSMPHVDPSGSDAWNTVVHGLKWWILFPMDSVQDDLEMLCDGDCSSETPSELHWYASVGVNAAQSDYGSRGQQPRHVLQGPGETIYVPYGIPHSVLNMGQTTAVTANYGAPSNLKRVWEAVVEEGFEGHWRKLYFGILDKEQRKEVRNSRFWPPSLFENEA